MKFLKKLWNLIKSWRKKRQFKKKIKQMNIKDPFIYR